MTKLFIYIIILFSLTNFNAKGQTKENVKFNISPNVFDSIVTFSFEIPKDDTVSIIILNRMAQTIEVISPPKYYSAGKHDIPYNLANLPPNKFLALLSVGQKKVNYKGYQRTVPVLNVQELMTRRSTKSNKSRDKYTDTTKFYY